MPLRKVIGFDWPMKNLIVALAERHHMQVSFETARMYTGDFPELPVNRLFGVTSFEIG